MLLQGIGGKTKAALIIGGLVILLLIVYAGLAQFRQAFGADKLTLQLKWLAQTQFAGYYVALEKGYYAQENLDVTIRPGGPGIATPEVLAAGEADVIVDWLPSALVAREQGIPLVNIAQPFKESAMMLVCRNDEVTSPVHFPGTRMGVWLAGNEYPFLGWMNRLGFPVDGGADGVEIVEQGADASLLSSGETECISMLTYGFWQLEEAGFADDQLTIFRFQDQGVAVLEDGLYALEGALEDPEFADKLARFVRASMRGWRFAEANQAETVEIVLSYDEIDFLDRPTQEYMMREVAKLTDGSDGALRLSDYWRTVNILQGDGSQPILSDIPRDGWTTAITDQALQDPTLW